jgi:hypothetical protein
MPPAVPIILLTMHKDVLRPAYKAALGIRVVMSKMDGLDLLGSHAQRLLA